MPFIRILLQCIHCSGLEQQNAIMNSVVYTNVKRESYLVSLTVGGLVGKVQPSVVSRVVGE